MNNIKLQTPAENKVSRVFALYFFHDFYARWDEKEKEG